MVEVNGAYKHGRCEQNWLNSLRVMSEVFAMQDGPPDEHNSLHRSICYSNGWQIWDDHQINKSQQQIKSDSQQLTTLQDVY